jgi:hypothetical protein
MAGRHSSSWGVQVSGGYDARVDESLARAFPARLAPAVISIAQLLPNAGLRATGSVTAGNSRTWPGLVVAGEPVVIPTRVYNPEPSPGAVAGLSHVGRVVAAAFCSRHHDGFVRQRQLGTLLGSDEPWTAPFIIQLPGEYVIEICRDIERSARTAFPARPAMQEGMLSFFGENRCFAALTKQRAISCWACYYRGLHASQDTYPALSALSILSGPAT